MVRVRGPLACFSLSESGDYITLHYITLHYISETFVYFTLVFILRVLYFLGLAARCSSGFRIHSALASTTLGVKDHHLNTGSRATSSSS